ncbi:Cytoplasmic glyoxalase II [Conglomerata obtusa]
MKLVSILIHEDNFTHICYNSSIAIAFDASDSDTLLLALSKSFEKEIYKSSEILSLQDHPTRKLEYIFTTHHHLDHSSGNKKLLDYCGNVLAYSKSTVKIAHNGTFDENFTLELTDFSLSVIHTPCHTKDSCCFKIETDRKFIVTGDTLFYLGVGKFFEGCGADMVNCIDKIKNIGDDYVCLYGHDYRKANLKFVEKFWQVPINIQKKMFLQIQDEKMYNPFMNFPRLNRQGSNDHIMDNLREEKNNLK